MNASEKLRSKEAAAAAKTRGAPVCVRLYVCVAGWVGEVESFYKPLSNSREKRTLASGRG